MQVDIFAYISDAAAMISVVLFVLGLILKQVRYIQDWMIYFVLLAIGILASLFMIGFTVGAALQGVLATGLASFVYQGFKQGKEGVNQQKYK